MVQSISAKVTSSSSNPPKLATITRNLTNNDHQDRTNNKCTHYNPASKPLVTVLVVNTPVYITLYIKKQFIPQTLMTMTPSPLLQPRTPNISTLIHFPKNNTPLGVTHCKKYMTLTISNRTKVSRTIFMDKTCHAISLLIILFLQS